MMMMMQKQPPEVFCKKGALENFAKLTGKQMCQSLFLIKLQASFFTFWWWWIIFVEWLTNDRRLALFPAGTTDKSSDKPRAGFESALNQNSDVSEFRIQMWRCFKF